MKATIKYVFDTLMKEPEANSRLVFLIHGFASGAGILMLTCMFPFVHDRTAFPMMVTAVGGGGVGAAIGRFFTKKGDGEQGDTPAPVVAPVVNPQ